MVDSLSLGLISHRRRLQAADKAGRDATALKYREEHHALPPNVVLAHLEEGIEAVHLYSGRTICKLHLPPSGLHTDLNADGVLDHIQVHLLLLSHCNLLCSVTLISEEYCAPR